jgi:hypothetical protein
LLTAIAAVKQGHGDVDLFITKGELANIALGSALRIDSDGAVCSDNSGPLEAVDRDHAHATLVADGLTLGVSISLASKRARSVTVRFEPPFSVEDDGAEQAAEVFSAWAARLQAHFGAKPTKQTKRRVEIVLRKPYAALVELSHHVTRGPDGDSLHSVTLSKSLDASVRLPVDPSELWFDLASVAPLLVSKKFDLAVVTQRAVDHFGGSPTFSLSPEWQRVVFEARAAHAKRALSVFEELLARFAWSDLDRVRWFFSYLCPSSPQDSYAAKRFSTTPIHTVIALIERLAPAPSDRAKLAVMIVRALERGDDDATRELGAMLAAQPGPTPPFNTPDAVSDRLFSVLTATLDDFGRLRFALRSAAASDEVVSACVRCYGGAALSSPLPAIDDARARKRAEGWARYFVMVRDRFAAHFDALIEEFARTPALLDKHAVAAIVAVVGQQRSKTVFGVGRVTFTVRGNQCEASVDG